MAVDSLWDKTVLLLPLSEDLQDVAKRRPFVAYGNAALSSAVGTPFGAGKACHFDGTGDYLRCPITSADFNLGTGDFDLSAWVYIVGDSAVNGSSVREAVILSVDNESNASTLEFYLGGNATTTGTHISLWDGTTGFGRSPASPLSKNVWYYVQATRVSGTVTFYLDGTQVGTSGSYNVQFGNSSQYAHVGGRTLTNYNDVLNGYIYDVRVTKGAARSTTLPVAPALRPTISGRIYDVSGAPAAKTILVRDRSTQRFLGGANSDPTTGVYTFYPPTFGEHEVVCVDGLFDPYTDECVFDLDPSTCLPYDQRLNHDNTGRALTFLGDVVIASDGFSFAFDGSGDSITSTSGNYILGTDDFSIELEFYPIAGGHGGAYSRILQIGANSTAGMMAITAYATANPLQLECIFYNGSGYVHMTGTPVTTTFANSTWHKFQMRRVSGVITVTVNDSTWATSGATAFNISLSQLVLGGNTSNTESFYGRIGKVRISRGARRAAAAIPASRLLKLPADGETGLLNALIRDRVIPD